MIQAASRAQKGARAARPEGRAIRDLRRVGSGNPKFENDLIWSVGSGDREFESWSFSGIVTSKFRDRSKGTEW